MNMEEWFGESPKIVIQTPATSANMGPGFDCLGMAVDLYNDLWIKVLDEDEEPSITIEGYGEGTAEALDNLIYKTYLDAFEKTGRVAPRLAMHCINRVPFARGLGSSSAAAISGLVAAQVVSEGFFSEDDMIQMSTAIDGHPDNVLPALMGGIVIGATNHEGRMIAKKMPVPEGLHTYALIPDYPLPTSKARAAMPDAYSKIDVVYNLGHLGLLVAALASGDLSLLPDAFADRIHEPYRLPLMPGIEEAKAIALEKGAMAALVSGAGSTMLIVSDKDIDFSETTKALEEKGFGAQLLEVAPINEGAKCYMNGVELELWH